ncbi:structural constituent of chitin-based cuticle [Nesidiocoris tenuis]|uniref:Structural constituent of chitin-based cuticle n=1 Tax=Nesidiocoris tenuis TaxID=355587 RepID=A0ABN7A9L3_9HEMI|nr:structural constituent of chitin-based cuticle [Nesidiocoris tenuis]
MMKIAVLLALAAACSAQVYSYSAAAPYTYPFAYGASPYAYGISPYAYGVSPYAYSAYAPIAKSYVAPAVVAPALVKSQYHAQDPLTGSAAYGHVEPGQAHSAIQDAAGNKVGSFSHVLPDGSISRTDYVADAMGYRVASNSLPINSGALPIPVSDTADVVAARAAHFAEVEKVKSRSKRAITYAAGAYAPVAYSGAYAPVAYSSAYTGAYAAPAVYSGSYYSAPAFSAYSKFPYYY